MHDRYVQEAIGHRDMASFRYSDIRAMDVYNHVTLEQKIASFKRLGETYKII